MNSRVKNFFKIFLIALGSVAATMAVVVGIMFLCGVFRQPTVELKSMYFTVKDLKSDNNCYFIDADSMISLVGYPDDTTEVSVNITFKKGENIITLPTKYKINEPFTILVNKNTMVLQNKTIECNVGGVVTLSAQNTDKTVACECTIFVDTFVESYNLITTDENGKRIYLNESGDTFYSFVENTNGDYGYDGATDEYKLLNELTNYSGKKYIRQESLIYPGNVFYVEATNVFPLNSLDKFASLTDTSKLKTFEVDTDSESATVEMVNNDKRAKITINSAQKITLSSFFVKSYNGMIRKAEIEQRLAEGVSNDEEENSLKAEIEALKVKSNTIVINPNPIKVTGIQTDVDSINVKVNTSKQFNSSKNSSSNQNGLGIVLKAPLGSNYSDAELNYRLAGMVVKTGYKSKQGETPDLTVNGQNITFSEDYIKVNKSYANNQLNLEVECYKLNVSETYENYIVLSLDDYEVLIKCYIENEVYPEIKLDSSLSGTKSMQNSKSEIIQEQLELSKILLASSNQPVNTNEYKVAFVIMKDNKIDATNDIIENEFGTVGSYQFVEDSNGKYGIKEENGQISYELLENLTNYTGKKYSKVFKDGLITLIPNKTGTLIIRACLVKKDFNGNIINFVEDANGQYGFYNGYYDLIANLGNYNGKRYSIGEYSVGVFSNDFITLNIENELEISGYTVLMADKATTVPFKDNINDYDVYRDKSVEDSQINPTIDLYMYETFSAYIKVECNEPDKLYNEYISSKYKISLTDNSSHIDVGTFNREGDSYMFQIYGNTKFDNIDQYAIINVMLEDADGNVLNRMQIRVHVLDSQIKSISLSSSAKLIKAKINNDYNVDWLDSTNNILKFELDYSPKRNTLNESYISYKYYSSYDEDTKTDVEDNSILKVVSKTLDTDAKTYLTCEVYKTGIVYVVAVYHDEENDLTLVSNAVEITVTADNLNVDDTNFVEDEKDLLPEGSKIYKNDIYDYGTLSVNDLFSVSNEQNAQLDNRLLIIKLAENVNNIKLELNNQENSADYNKYQLSTINKTNENILVPIIVSTKTGQEVGKYWIKIVPNVKVEINAQLTQTENKNNIDNKQYYFDIEKGSQIDLSSILITDAQSNVYDSSNIRYSFSNAKLSMNGNTISALTEGESSLVITVIIGQQENDGILDNIYYTITITFNIKAN